MYNNQKTQLQAGGRDTTKVDEALATAKTQLIDALS